MQYGAVEGWLTDSGAKIDRVLAPSGKARLKSFLPWPILVPRCPWSPGFAFSLDKYILSRFPPALDRPRSLFLIIGLLFLSFAIALLYIVRLHALLVRHRTISRGLNLDLALHCTALHCTTGPRSPLIESEPEPDGASPTLSSPNLIRLISLSPFPVHLPLTRICRHSPVKKISRFIPYAKPTRPRHSSSRHLFALIGLTLPGHHFYACICDGGLSPQHNKPSEAKPRPGLALKPGTGLD